MDVLSQVAELRQQAAVLLTMADALEQRLLAEADGEAAYDTQQEDAESRHRLAVLEANGMTTAPF